MAGTPEQPHPAPAPAPTPAPAQTEPRRFEHGRHEVNFVTYPKLLFIWPLILAGFIFWPLGKPANSSAGTVPVVVSHGQVVAPTSATTAAISPHLHTLGWAYLWIAVLVILTMGVDIDRNHAAFWVLLVVAVYILGLWLRDVRHFTLFGDIYRWFAALDVQYDRALGLVLSILLLIPYLIMLIWGRFNDRWRITHNEFEHFSFGRLDDSLGRGAKTIRSSYPDMFELLLGFAGTLVVYNASGTRELRRIPHVMCLPFVRKRLNRILETTSVTATQSEEEEEDEEHNP
jgi:hypothetical protein